MEDFLKKLNECYLTYEDAMYLIREWNYKIRTYGRVTAMDLKIFLNMMGEKFELNYIDQKCGWDEFLGFNRGLIVEVGTYSIKVKFDLVTCKLFDV